LQHKIEAKKNILKVFQGFVDSGVSTYEKVCKESKVTWNVLYALEGKLLVSQRNDNVAWSLPSKVHKGLVASICIPFPCVLVDSNEMTCVWVEHCPFCGLGFQPLWARLITSCKHVYHSLCAFVHFNQSRKHVHNFCGENMHDGSWVVVKELLNMGAHQNQNVKFSPQQRKCGRSMHPK
jgi:hypothetical protein